MIPMETRPNLRLSTTRFGDLDCTVLSPASTDVTASFCTVFCHGFGAPGNDLVALGPDLAALCPELAESVLFVFPQAPLDLTKAGMPGGRAWWMLDIERFQRLMGSPERAVRFRHEIPAGMPEAGILMSDFLTDVGCKTGIPVNRTLLGGFSQGSMVATDLALSLSEPPAGLCIFSGTLLSEDRWRELARNRGSLPVLQSHGYFDPILPFSGAEALREMLTEAGLPVEFIPFDGPHTITYEALERLAQLMRRVFIK